MTETSENRDGAHHEPATPMDENQKLQVRLTHWVAHNRSHSEEFKQGAEQARSSNLPDVARAINQAGELLQQAGEFLDTALQAMEKP